jgi:hypothetical protein
MQKHTTGQFILVNKQMNTPYFGAIIKSDFKYQKLKIVTSNLIHRRFGKWVLTSIGF